MEFWLLIIFLITIFYLLDRYFLTFWSSRGFSQAQTSFFVGNIGSVIKGGSFADIFKNAYNQHKSHGVIGIYFMYRPVLIINDPKIVQDVMIRDFNSFHDRGSVANPKRNPLSNHLFSITGQEWRDLRVKLSPTFTSGKLKAMYSTINDCAKVLEDFLTKNIKSGNNEIQFRDLFARYTTNVISSVAFGVDNDCINDPENIFRRTGIKMLEINLWKRIFRVIATLTPDLFVRFNLKTIDKEVEDFFFNLVRQTIEFREKNKDYERKDFMQLMIQLKNQGYVSADRGDEIKNETQKKFKNLTLNEIAGQAFIFFLAGFETSSSTMNFCAIELCKNPKIQRKIQEELDEVVKDGELTYETLNKLKYLDCCIDETLRKYPILPALSRVCTKQYKFADSDLVIEKGTSVFIPVIGLHHDPDIYENPMEFKPERFMDSPTGSSRTGIYYNAFGEGPRNCIGARMGKVQTKLGLATVLRKFSFEFADKSYMNEEIKFDPTQFLLAPKDGILFKITERKL